MSWAQALLTLVAAASWLPAQTQWQLHGAGMKARCVVAGRSTSLTGGKLVELPAGAASVHFPSNVDGQPASLEFAVPEGANVAIAVARAADARRSPLKLPAKPSSELPSENAKLPTQLLLPEIASLVPLKDYRVSITVAADSSVGLVARHHAERGCYLFCIDADAGEARLHRFMGGHEMVLRKAALTTPVPERVTLSLQVHGFRLRAALDDRPVITCFDGALSVGGPAVAFAGENPGLSTVLFEPPATRVSSVACVQVDGTASIHAAVCEAAGHFAVLQLALDRPHPWVPRSPAGIEPFLRQPPAAPVVLLGDWRNSLGSNAMSEVGYEGKVYSQIALPRLPALANRSLLASFLMVTPDGGSILARTPPVPLQF